MLFSVLRMPLIRRSSTCDSSFMDLRVFQLAQPVGDGAARHLELVGEVGHRQARVLAQGGSEEPVRHAVRSPTLRL
jgi:hypothetical protein